MARYVLSLKKAVDFIAPVNNKHFILKSLGMWIYLGWRCMLRTHEALPRCHPNLQYLVNQVWGRMPAILYLGGGGRRIRSSKSPSTTVQGQFGLKPCPNKEGKNKQKTTFKYQHRMKEVSVSILLKRSPSIKKVTFKLHPVYSTRYGKNMAKTKPGVMGEAHL